MLMVDPEPASLVANTDTPYRVVSLRPVKLILLMVVIFSTISCSPLYSLTLYTILPQAQWLKVFHDTVNESSATSVTIRFGLSGVPTRKQYHYVYYLNTFICIYLVIHVSPEYTYMQY